MTPLTSLQSWRQTYVTVEIFKKRLIYYSSSTYNDEITSLQLRNQPCNSDTFIREHFSCSCSIGNSEPRTRDGSDPNKQTLTYTHTVSGVIIKKISFDQSVVGTFPGALLWKTDKSRFHSYLQTIIPDCGVWKWGCAGWNWWRYESRHLQRYLNLPWVPNALQATATDQGRGCQHVEQLHSSGLLYDWSKLAPTEFSRLVFIPS